MTLHEYIEDMRGKRIAIIGIGVSNTPLLELLLAEGIRVTACDKRSREQMGEQAEHLEQLGCELHLGADYLKDLDADVIFRTPGLRPDVPEIAACVDRGAVLTSEMEVFFRVCPCHMIAVTGSDGKTTTTSIIAEMLRAAGKTVYLGGNIGHPLLCDAEKMQPEDFAVAELSSFQLLDMKRSPHIAVMTNLAPNHLDVHKDMDEYIAAKENIYLHQHEGDIAIFNEDNDITRSLSKKASARTRLFSRREEVADGAFLRGDTIVLRHDGCEEAVMQISDIRLPGMHNVENYLAAVTALDGLVPYEVMRETARTFVGVEHRIEPVRTIRGVQWYNDSIASSPTRTIAGLNAFNEKVILLAGGYDKHISFGVSVCSQLLSDILGGFYEKRPDANITVHTGYPLDCMQDHLDLVLDAYPQLTTPSSDTESLQKPVGDILMSEEICIAYAASHPFARETAIPRSILYHYPCILPSPESRMGDLLDDLWKRYILRPLQSSSDVNNSYVQCELVSQGRYFTLVPQKSWRPAYTANNLILAPLPNAKIYRHICLYRQPYLSALALEFADYLHTYFAAL